MLFHSPTGASLLDVPDELVQFYIDHGFKPVEQKANEPTPRKRAPRKTKTEQK